MTEPTTYYIYRKNKKRTIFILSTNCRDVAEQTIERLRKQQEARNLQGEIWIEWKREE